MSASATTQPNGGRRQVPVSPYDRVVDGKFEHVSGYTQSRQASQRRPVEKQQASTETEKSDKPEPAAEAGQRPVVIFVGGFLDGVFRPVGSYKDFFESSNLGIQVKYFGHDELGGLRSFIASLPRGTRISLVGHSWGADTAAQVAAALGADRRPIAELITIDPVGSLTGSNFYNRVAAGARRWLNVDAVGGEWWDFSNIVAGIGGRYGSGPRGIAHGFIEAQQPHANFEAMLRQSTFNGMTLEDRLRGLK